MKVYCVDYNSVLTGIIERLKGTGRYTDNYHEADVFLLWQDVRGEMQELADIVKNQLRKPVVVMQHGRGATRDYGPPNNFGLIADKICVWGESEKRRLLRYGVSEDRVAVTGCPLFPKLRPKAKDREGKNVLFVPVIAGKEEPENLLVYAALKKWESEKLIRTITDLSPRLKKAWAIENNEQRIVTMPDGTKEKRLWKKEIIHSLPRWVTYGAGLINVKLTPVHDSAQYMSPSLVSNPGVSDHFEALLQPLLNTDVMVCLEEGTMQLIACALDIPVIVVDIFQYGTYGGTKDYDRVEKIRTGSCYWLNGIEKLGSAIDHALAFPDELRKSRIKVVEDEAAPQLGDACANVIRVLESVASDKAALSIA